MKKQNMGLMLGMMMAMNESSMHNHSTPNESVIKKPKKKIIPKGLKQFFYGEKAIYALNKKNADKKARKQGLII